MYLWYIITPIFYFFRAPKLKVSRKTQSLKISDPGEKTTINVLVICCRGVTKPAIPALIRLAETSEKSARKYKIMISVVASGEMMTRQAIIRNDIILIEFNSKTSASFAMAKHLRAAAIDYKESSSVFVVCDELITFNDIVRFDILCSEYKMTMIMPNSASVFGKVLECAPAHPGTSSSHRHVNRLVTTLSKVFFLSKKRQ